MAFLLPGEAWFPSFGRADLGVLLARLYVCRVGEETCAGPIHPRHVFGTTHVMHHHRCRQLCLLIILCADTASL